MIWFMVLYLWAGATIGLLMLVIGDLRGVKLSRQYAIICWVALGLVWPGILFNLLSKNNAKTD